MNPDSNSVADLLGQSRTSTPRLAVAEDTLVALGPLGFGVLLIDMLVWSRHVQSEFLGPGSSPWSSWSRLAFCI